MSEGSGGTKAASERCGAATTLNVSGAELELGGSLDMGQQQPAMLWRGHCRRHERRGAGVGRLAGYGAAAASGGCCSAAATKDMIAGQPQLAGVLAVERQLPAVAVVQAC